MSLQKILVGFTLTALVAFAMFMFGHNIAVDNDSTSIIETSAMRNMSGSLNKTLNTFEDLAQTQRENVETESPKSGFGTLVIFGIIGAVKTFTSMTVSLTNVLFGGLSTVIGVPPMVLGVMFSILIVALLLMGWRVIKGGE